MSEAKCSRIDPNTFVRYRIEFGRRGRSFPSMEELKDFTKTPEFEKLNTRRTLDHKGNSRNHL